MGLGANVGKLVKARGVSYGDVARGIGINDAQAIWNLVKRKSRQSRFSAQLATYFNVPLDRLLADDFDVTEIAAAVAPALKLAIEEAEAISRLRKAHPHWRRYVLGLAMVDSEQAQALMLTTMRQAVPDYKVENAYGEAPHVAKQHELRRVTDSAPQRTSGREVKKKVK